MIYFSLYELLKSGSCSSEYYPTTLDESYGIVSSKHWPQDYPSYQDCYWKIDVGDDKKIKIAFMDFDLEYDLGCGDDKLKVKGEKAHLCLLVLSQQVILTGHILMAT